MRKPTDREFQDYDGMHCRSLWQSLPEDWRCPVCNRNKRGILQWGVRKGSNASKYGPILVFAGRAQTVCVRYRQRSGRYQH